MSIRVESTIERAVAATPLRNVIAPERSVRLVEWALVGLVGMAVDLTVTFALLDATHYLAANAMGFAVAVTTNFVGNWTITYDRPSGRLSHQYLSYVALHIGTFSLRAVTIALLVEWQGTATAIATVIGVLVAATANFAGTERVFGGAGEVWFDIVEAANHIAHVLYGSRVRQWLLSTGLYGVVFATYARVLALAYRDDEREITINGASAIVKTETPTEIVSVLHTLENERDVLERYLSDVEPKDHVIDVGSNLGLFSLLAADRGARTTAVEPHERTARRCEENFVRNDVEGEVINAALGDSVGTVELAVRNDAIGTQRPAVEKGGQQTVRQLVGDDLPTPDVLKIDVEGAESKVLDGFTETVTSRDCRVIYVEAHSESDCRALEARLSAAGYICERISSGEQIHLRAGVPDLVAPEDGIGSNDATGDQI